MLAGNSNTRWKTQVKPGQAVACKVIDKADGGYYLEFGQRLKGFLPTERAIALGCEILLEFVGYRNQLAIFNAGYGLIQNNKF